MKPSVLILSFLIPISIFAQPSFQEVVNLPFYDDVGYLRGISWVDVDNDNDLDVCISGLAGIPPNTVNLTAVYENQGNNTFVNNGWITSNQLNAGGHAWADIDNDGDLDGYFAATWNQGGINELWINDGTGAMTMNPSSGATPNTALPYEGTVSWGDYNNDGFVDLHLAVWNNQGNKLYHNNGDGTFSEITNGQIVTDPAWTSGGYWGDYDNDGDLDIYIANYQIGSDPGANDLLENNGNGTFTKVTGAGAIITDADNTRTANWVDADNNGFLDVFVTNQGSPNRLYLNNGDGTFSAQSIGPSNTSWSANWGDYDNDGDQDLFVMGFFGSDSKFYENDGSGNLSEITANFPNILPTETNGSNSNGVLFVDYDLDGWLDLHLTQPNTSPDKLFRNEGLDCKSWLKLKCTGSASNRAAIGSTVRAKANVGGMSVWQMRQVSSQTSKPATNPLWLHFGFEESAIIDSLIVEWPSGQVCVFEQVAVNQFIELVEENCTVNTIIDAPPIPGFSQELILCGPTDTLLSPMGGAGGNWSSNCGDCLDDSGLFSSVDLQSGSYQAIYTVGGVCGSLDTFEIHVDDFPMILTIPDTTILEGDSLVLSTTGATNYTWEPAEGLSCSDCADPEFTGTDTTNYIVTGTTEFGCSNTDTLTIFVIPTPELLLPNAFTPDGDGVNDVFRPVYTEGVFTQYNLVIYNRWGNQVFESQVASQGWDGKADGEDSASDIYVYILEYELSTGERGVSKGDLTLIR